VTGWGTPLQLQDAATGDPGNPRHFLRAIEEKKAENRWFFG